MLQELAKKPNQCFRLINLDSKKLSFKPRVGVLSIFGWNSRLAVDIGQRILFVLGQETSSVLVRDEG